VRLDDIVMDDVTDIWYFFNFRIVIDRELGPICFAPDGSWMITFETNCLLRSKEFILSKLRQREFHATGCVIGGQNGSSRS